MKIKIFIIFTALMVLIPIIYSSPAHAFWCRPPATCSDCCPRPISNCQRICVCVSNAETGNPNDYSTTMGHITNEFNKHRDWMEQFFFNDAQAGNPAGLLAALKLMAEQIALNAMQQVQIIGAFFDAKHQLETQRLFQVMTAKAHKDYQPSKNLCYFGSMSQSLAESTQKSENVSNALARRSIDRQIMSNNNISVVGAESDKLSRLRQYIEDYCDPNDNSGENDLLCTHSLGNANNYNKDISFSQTITQNMTIPVDVTENLGVSQEEENLFALQDNLISHDLYPTISPGKLVDEEGNPAYQTGAEDYLHARSVVAKRSVAGNSIASIAALRAEGDDKAETFIYSLIEQMGGSQTTINEIRALIGDNPSYYAQMKVLTKIFYQRPDFYSDLYDKPANIARMNAAIQAATLMRKRDLYRSYLRSEMTLAVMLETALIGEIRLIEDEINRKAGTK